MLWGNRLELLQRNPPINLVLQPILRAVLRHPHRLVLLRHDPGKGCLAGRRRAHETYLGDQVGVDLWGNVFPPREVVGAERGPADWHGRACLVNPPVHGVESSAYVVAIELAGVEMRDTKPAKLLEYVGFLFAADLRGIAVAVGTVPGLDDPHRWI